MDHGAAHGAGRVITLCFHGAESTGKSVLAAQLAAQSGVAWVPEYGRTYCETHGTDLTMEDLLAIAEGQAAAVDAARAAQPRLLILDTDQLMTAAWARMLFGRVPPALLAYPKADLYLLFAADVPWIDDGTRMFGAADRRAAFAATAEAVLIETGVPYRRIGGSWAARDEQVRAITGALLAGQPA